MPEIQSEEDAPCDECGESNDEWGVQQVIVKPVGAQKARKFWAKARENRDFRRVYEFIIAHDYVPIKRGKGAEDTLVYYVQGENYEGMTGFISFTQATEEPTSEAELMYGEIEYTDSLGITDSTTIAQPFAFYFGERPEGIQCEVLAADDADTVWVGEVGGTKGIKSWLKCVAVVTATGFGTSLIGCIWSNMAYLACVGAGTGAAAVGGMIGCGVYELLH